MICTRHILIATAMFTVACGGPKLDYADQILARDQAFGEAEPGAEALARYQAAADYAGDFGALNLLIIEGNDVAYEWTAEGYDANAPHHLFSGTKSFSCAVAALLEQDGTLDLDAPVSGTIPELASGDDVTARHLLHFTSGIEQRFFDLSTDGMLENQRIDDKYAYSVGLEGQWASGSRFQYGSSHQMVFGELVKRLDEGNALTILDERVFGPIGLAYGGWHHDPAGNPMLPYGAWTTAWEWAKYGVLMRDDGLWKGERVLPEGVREACSTGSEANPAYGLTWWLNGPLGDDADLGGIQSLATDGTPILHPTDYPDAFVAAGHDHQRLWVVPSLDLVAVLISDGTPGFDDREMFMALVP